MGDNRDRSDDSRYWGFVPDDHLRGRAFFIWFNWDDISIARVQAGRQRHSIGRAAMQMRTRQRGLSMIGFLFVAVVVVVCVMVGFRVLPAYIEYYSVQKALEQALVDAKDLNSARRDPQRVPEARGRRVHRIRAGQGRRDFQDQERGDGQRELEPQAAAGRQRQPVPRVRGLGDAVATSPAA